MLRSPSMQIEANHCIEYLHYFHYLALSSSTPLDAFFTGYECWYRQKPNITHLQEFGVPIWILLQGQSKLLKMEPRSKH
jgi:hypothetical protein